MGLPGQIELRLRNFARTLIAVDCRAQKIRSVGIVVSVFGDLANTYQSPWSKQTAFETTPQFLNRCTRLFPLLGARVALGHVVERLCTRFARGGRNRIQGANGIGSFLYAHCRNHSTQLRLRSG